MSKKMILGAVSCALMGVSQLHAATYDSTAHLITLNNIQGLNNNAPTFNTSANIQASDSAALHKGQTYKITNTGIAFGNPDARYTVGDSKLTIPNLLQDASTLLSVTLQLTNPTTGELTVLEVVNTSLGTQGSTSPVGTAIGDMQYWDGTQWAIVPAGSNGTYLVFCDGKPTWGTCKTTPTPAPAGGYKIGDTGPAGGIVFSVDASLVHGLEAQSADYNNRQELTWSDAIIAGTSYGSGWHLPTKDELNKLYQYKTTVGGFANAYYWSSTEYDAGSAWYQGFGSGYQYYDGKTHTYLVRAVRAF